MALIYARDRGWVLEDADGGPIVHINHLTTVDRGQKGVFRCIGLDTDRDNLEIYITPTGLTRVFRKGKGEMKVGT